MCFKKVYSLYGDVLHKNFCSDWSGKNQRETYYRGYSTLSVQAFIETFQLDFGQFFFTSPTYIDLMTPGSFVDL